MSFRECLKVSSILLQCTDRNVAMAVCRTSEKKPTNGLLVSIAMGFWPGSYSCFKKIN